jgi:uncharacterized membrane protein YraQ (UPF0718 family)
MDFILNIFQEAWNLLIESSVYIIFGLLISGLFKVFLNPDSVARHLGKGRFLSVIKASILGIPLPLCSCGVLPAAASLKKQGANNGATTSFLISTPESGVDSIAVTYALLDPIMTVARPLVAFFTAAGAGLIENLFSSPEKTKDQSYDLSCPVDGCCDKISCSPEEHKTHHSFIDRIVAGLRYAFTDVWNDIANWFFVGLILAGLITASLPDEIFSNYLDGGLSSMFLMLVIGIPLYICATASTPIAAALILKGVSPGTALVFLLAGPATNITSLTVLLGILGKRATTIYLMTIGLFSILFGLMLDRVYIFIGISAKAIVGQASEFMPGWMEWTGAFFLVLLSVKPISKGIITRFKSWSSTKQKLTDKLYNEGNPVLKNTCTGPD